MLKRLISWFSLITMISVVTLVGCSGEMPFSPSGAATDVGAVDVLPLVSGEVQFTACVQTADQNRQMLTFTERPDTVFALHNCQIVRLNNGNETPIPFSDIHPGDSVGVQGHRQQNGYIYAYKLQLKGQSAGSNYDLAFRDTIVTIDYQAGSFTVAGRSETILVDENTVVWTNFPRWRSTTQTQMQNQGDTSVCLTKLNPDWINAGHDTLLAFSDLAEGDVVEIKANIIDESTLLAVSIKLAFCEEKTCVQFTDVLGSVDPDNRLVTFANETWIGLVCRGAKLLGADGEILTLADFSAGEAVFVKGFPTTGDSLKICLMEKQ